MNVISMKNPKNIPLIKRSDIILIALVLVGTALLFCLSTFSAEGRTAVVTLDGEELTVINLQTAQDEVFTAGNVTVEVKDGKVSIIDSDCPDKTCVRTGELSKSGDASVCVPNRVSVEITGESADGVDIMAY
ncbi:MAG: NusG domain II-containing protein [Clostridia bacterium]|nr:NusG domain II-containing protein [Clostridia bacterium]